MVAHHAAPSRRSFRIRILKCAWLEPGAVCFVGLTGWRHAVDRHAAAGPQDHHIGGRPVYVMPSTSGANAHTQLDALSAHLAAAESLTAEV